MTADLFAVKRRIRAAVPTLSDADAHRAAEAVLSCAPVATKADALTSGERWLRDVCTVRLQAIAARYDPTEARAIARILAGKDPA